MRDAFAASLIELGPAQPDIFVLDADCSHSTRSYRFGELNPSAFLNVGIAEQNMMSMAAGLAMHAYIPFVCGFAAIMIARAGEQIIQSIAYPNLNVKIAGHYSGISASREGAPHHAIADIAFLRAIPNMRIYSPADDADVAVLLQAAAEHRGPVYLRLARDAAPPIPGGRYEADREIRIWGGPCDVALVTTGAVTSEAIAAANSLREIGVATSVFSVLRLKPFPQQFWHERLSSCSLVVSIEEHNIIGGLGSAMAEMIAELGLPIRHLRLGIQDRFTETGSYNELLDLFGLSADRIVESCLAALGLERGRIQ
ncbi:transketolase family protein [Bradyrhizobium sp. USDA 336]|uniref:transketolase family protein n=1 Tax=Bradyrhizobium sp. USDA 336 TaxID=3156311 RepID=UPI003839043A